MLQTKLFSMLFCAAGLCALISCYSNLLQRGKIYEEMGDYNSAIRSYQKAAETSDPHKKAKALSELGRLYLQFGTTDYYWKAEEILKEAKKLLNSDHPLYPDVSYYLGYCYYELGTPWAIETISNFEDALRSKDDHVPSHFYLGTLYYQSGGYKQALVHLNRVSGTPHDAQAKYIAGMSHWKLGERGKANGKLLYAVRLEFNSDKQKVYKEALDQLAKEEEEIAARSAKIMNVEPNPVLAANYKSYDI